MRVRVNVLVVAVVVAAIGLGGCKKKSRKEGSTDTPGAAKAKAKRRVSVPESLPEPKVKAEPVTFVKKMHPRGTVVINHTRMKMFFTLKGPKGEMNFSHKEDERTHDEVLEVKDATVTKLKVTYKKKFEESARDGKIKRKESPLTGKTFILEHKDGTVQVTDGAGKPVSEELTKLLRHEHPTFGVPERFFQNLPTAAIKPGERVKGIETAIKQEGEDENSATADKKIQLSAVSAVYKGTGSQGGAKVAVFAVSMQVKIEEGGTGMVLHGKGYLFLRVSGGWKTRLEIIAGMDIMGQKKAGRMHAVETYTLK